MKNQSTALIILFLANASFLPISNLSAGPVERSTVESARKVVNDLKINAITTKAQLDVTAKDLTAQRTDLQQKIRTTRKDFKTNTTSIKTSSKKALDNLHAALKKLKDSTIVIEESHDADALIAQSATDEAALNQATIAFDQVTLPKEIAD